MLCVQGLKERSQHAGHLEKAKRLEPRCQSSPVAVHTLRRARLKIYLQLFRVPESGTAHWKDAGRLAKRSGHRKLRGVRSGPSRSTR